MKLKLSSKAQTLEDLAGIITSANVLPLIRFYAKEYFEKKEAILSSCIDRFDTDLIVRSSSSNEDNEFTSNAGGFDSVANVKLDTDALDDAVQKVIKSYGDNVSVDDEVLIQPMLGNVTMSGVIFTSDIDVLTPYYIINYDESGSTSSVTNGDKANLKTFVSFKKLNHSENKYIDKLLTASKECEDICENIFLDIEFAFDDDKLYILQVRPIVQKNKNNLSRIGLTSSLSKLYKKIKKLNASHPKLLGDRGIFGVMPDWNPAEIIGVKPKRLALSLYKEIITDEIWAYQRDNYGYRSLRSFPLLHSFLGVPYIDVRVSFNSFIPKNLHDSISTKLVNYYLEELSKNSNHHDKVEFEIVYSCYYFGIDKKLQKLKGKNFSDNEIKRVEFELLELTNNIIDIKSGLYKKDLEKIEKLNEKYDETIRANLSLVDKIYWLIEDCKRYGTLPFAGVARAAFIAVQFLNSLENENVITRKDKEKFLNSLNTVSKSLSQDKKKMPKDKFIEKYGHLRPGTYDINSKRYDEAYDEYFEECQHDVHDVHDGFFEFSLSQKETIDKLAIESGLKCSADNLLTFVKEAIEGREYAKFVFTKNLSQVLVLIEEFGDKLTISRDDLAYLDIQKVKNLYSILDHREVRDIFIADIAKNKDYYEYTKAVKLPSLIVNEDDIYNFYLEDEDANFVTLNSINSVVVDIDDESANNLVNRILCIKSADPGYDYLFSKNIGGLITCYGGANSHMAIRCAELGIPAVIGCGEKMFAQYRKANVIMIDAANKQVKILS
jgi:phosphohistidine swiveling domain-containing protein